MSYLQILFSWTNYIQWRNKDSVLMVLRIHIRHDIYNISICFQLRILMRKRIWFDKEISYPPYPQPMRLWTRMSGRIYCTCRTLLVWFLTCTWDYNFKIYTYAYNGTFTYTCSQITSLKFSSMYAYSCTGARTLTCTRMPTRIQVPC